MTEMFRVDAVHSGVYASAAPSLESVRWRFHSGGAIISSPAVVNGAVYVGSNDGNLYAVRQSSGTPLWHYATHGAVTSSPAFAGGTV